MEPKALPGLFLFRINVVTNTPKRESRFYFVKATSQCAATKYTAIRDEVDEILHVMLWDKPLPDDATITFETYKPCP